MSDTAQTTLAPAATSAPSVTFGFVKLIVRDLEGALAFYEEALGLVAAQTMESPVMTEKVLRKPGAEGGAALILYHHKDGRPLTLGDAHGPVGFYVRDVDAAYAHAVASGGKPAREPADFGTLRAAFVLDPEGHEIELVSIKR
ncbi:MAG TPA: VOC family protein [Phenylobacterium sp.]